MALSCKQDGRHRLPYPDNRTVDMTDAKSSEKSAGSKPAITIKKYANRRLYNTGTSTYVTLDDLATLVPAPL